MPSMPNVAAAPAGPVLRDIHLPPAPPWWPPAPGWWLVFGLACVLLALAIWLWRRWLRRRQQHELLLTELDGFARLHRMDGDDAALATRLHHLLRRVARQHVPHATQQRGDAWRQTLTAVTTDPTTLEPLLALELAMYRKDTHFNSEAVLSAVRHWLRLAQKPGRWKRALSEQAHV